MAGVTAAERRRELGQQFRVDSIRMNAAAKSGHPTSAMSAADLMAVLVDGYLRYDFSSPKSPANDRLVFSKGHASTLLYAIYRAAGVVSDDELMTYRRLGSKLEGHPTPRAAVGRRRDGVARPGPSDRRRDGARRQVPRTPRRAASGCSAATARWPRARCGRRSSTPRTYELDNLTAIIDVNRLGQRGETMVGWDLDVYVARAEAFGWHAIEVDGHDVEADRRRVRSRGRDDAASRRSSSRAR